MLHCGRTRQYYKQGRRIEQCGLFETGKRGPKVDTAPASKKTRLRNTNAPLSRGYQAKGNSLLDDGMGRGARIRWAERKGHDMNYS